MQGMADILTKIALGARRFRLAAVVLCIPWFPNIGKMIRPKFQCSESNFAYFANLA